MSKYIYIEVETVYKDNVGKLSKISEDDLNKLMPLIEAINNFKPYLVENIFNEPEYNNYNYCTDKTYINKNGKPLSDIYKTIPKDLFDLFDEYLPDTEFGFMRIVDISVLLKIEKLL